MNILIQIVNYVVHVVSTFFIKVVELCTGKKDIGSEPLPKFELVEDVKPSKSTKTKKKPSGSVDSTKPVKQPKKVETQPKQNKVAVDKVKTPKKSAKKKTGV